MINIKNHKQGEFFDPWAFLSLKRRALLDKSWAGLFQKHLLCELPVGEIVPFFNEHLGRPSKELYTALGAIMLQQIHDLTDAETVDQLAFNIQWHYALNITEESDSAKYMCPKTLWNIRNTVVENQLDTLLFEHCTEKLAKVFKVNTNKQRIDSVHIKSNMQRLGRIRIFSTTIHKFLVNLKRGHKEHFDTIAKELIDRYLTEKALECFSQVKPSESGKTLSSLSRDLFDLIEQFKDCPEVTTMHSYKLLERVLREQCHVDRSGDSIWVEPKPPKQVPSDSLQNPSDPDAAYSSHKGQGYQVQVMETYTQTEDKNLKTETLNLITHIDVEKASESDANALIPALESARRRGLGPEQVLADTLYGSDRNCEKAKSMGVELISPTKSGGNERDGLQLKDFEFEQNGHVRRCPQGHAPLIKKKKKTRFTQGFAFEACSQCPLVSQCPAKEGKNYYYLRYEEKVMRLAKRRAKEQTDAFKGEYRWRSGVEATMSEYDRRTGVKRLRVRGLKAVRFCATLKAIGINLFRAVAVRCRNGINGDRSYRNAQFELLYAFYLIKEQCLSIWSRTMKMMRLISWIYRNHALGRRLTAP